MIDALRMQIEDLEREISEYEDLKEGRLLSFGADPRWCHLFAC